MTRLHATISVDLDNLWAYQRTRGDPAWERMGSYLQIAVPRMLDAFDEAGVRATVFIVGADAAREGADQLLGPITARGHEVGNHSYWHSTWLHRSDPGLIAEDLHRAHEAIRGATGQEPVGFRGPGFTWSGAVLKAVADLGYLFDASSLPTFISPLARWRLLRTARLTDAERRLRRDLFGSLRDGFRSNRPYRWILPDGRRLLEIPVTTMPLIRVPFHQSYVVYLASYSRRMARTYLRASLAVCRTAEVGPSFLFHPLDWLTGQEVPELRFFPGMDLELETKLALLQSSITLLRESFGVETMAARSRQIGGSAWVREMTLV